MTNDIKAIADGLSGIDRLREDMRLVEYDMLNRHRGEMGDGFVGERSEVSRIIADCRALLDRITALEAGNASLREALIGLATQPRVEGINYRALVREMSDRAKAALSTQGTTDKGEAS